jgi:hypothetical protein
MRACCLGGDAGGVSGVTAGGDPGGQMGRCLLGIGNAQPDESSERVAPIGGGVGDERSCGGLTTIVAILPLHSSLMPSSSTFYLFFFFFFFSLFLSFWPLLSTRP